MQTPQGPVAEQVLVGVQVELVEQGALSSTVQGVRTRNVGEVMQRPSQVSVCIKVEPVRRGSPNVQLTVNTGPGVVEEELKASGIMVNNSTSFILTKTRVQNYQG